MERPDLRFAGPVLGARDPLALAEFYSRLLDWPIAAREGGHGEGDSRDGWAIIRAPSGGQKLEFQYEPTFTPPVWPAVAGAQQMHMHLDIGAHDLAAAVARAVELGATVAEHQPQAEVRVMRDPAGHLFCLFPDAR